MNYLLAKVRDRKEKYRNPLMDCGMCWKQIYFCIDRRMSHPRPTLSGISGYK